MIGRSARYALLAVVWLAPALAQPYFTDQTALAGLTAPNIFGDPHHKEYILEAHGSGAGFFDYDGDGNQDLYVVNGSDFERYQKRSGPGNILYRNVGDGTFEDRTAAAGVGDASWGAGCAVGDIDNDGYRDLYVTNYGANVLYHNQRDGRFNDITATAGVAGDDYSSAAAFFDYDKDGDLDLYVANYVVFDLDDNPRVGCDYVGGIKTYCGPLGMEGGADVLYRNDGSGRYADVTAASGVDQANSYFGLGVVPCDYDGDGNLDLYVANDQTPNVLFQNRGDGRFVDVALVAGVAYSGDGDEESGMGVDFGDFDNDGDFDVYVTNFFRESNTLYRSEGRGHFADFTVEAGIEAVTLASLGWGTHFGDFDNDGDLDLFVANGHVFPQVDDAPTGTSYRQRNQLFRNDINESGRFVDISNTAGPAMAIEKVSRGASFADYDDDGDVDVFVVNLNDTPTLLRNDLGSGASWLTVQVDGGAGGDVNRDGVGARLRLVAGGQAQFRMINGAGSYLSHNDLRAHFGLGDHRLVEVLEIVWPDGMTQTATSVPVNRTVIMRRGQTLETPAASSD